MTAANVVTQPDLKQRYDSYAILAENAPLTRGPVMARARRIHSLLSATEVPTLVYAGSIQRNRGLYCMLEIVAELNEIRPWRLKLIGPFLRSSVRKSAKERRGCAVEAYRKEMNINEKITEIDHTGVYWRKH